MTPSELPRRFLSQGGARSAVAVANFARLPVLEPAISRLIPNATPLLITAEAVVDCAAFQVGDRRRPRPRMLTHLVEKCSASSALTVSYFAGLPIREATISGLTPDAAPVAVSAELIPTHLGRQARRRSITYRACATLGASSLLDCVWGRRRRFRRGRRFRPIWQGFNFLLTGVGIAPLLFSRN